MHSLDQLFLCFSLSERFQETESKLQRELLDREEFHAKVEDVIGKINVTQKQCDELCKSLGPDVDDIRDKEEQLQVGL